MSSPPASSAKSSAVAAAAAAAAALRAQGSSLPFSIEQILSSPIKPSHGPMSAVEQLGAMEPAARQLADLMAASQPAHMMAAHQLLNPLAMATGGDNILQYFMAYMLSSIQQQQQHHINNNSTSAGQQQLMGIQSPLSQLKSSQHHLAQQQQQSHHQAQQQLLAAAQLAAAQQQIQAAALNYPLNPLSSTAGGLPNPLLSCFTNCIQPQPPHLLQQQPPPPPPRHQPMHQSPPIEQTVSRSASFLPSAKLISSQRSSYSAGYKSTSSAGHQNSNKTSASSKLTASGHEQSTALSSLSNFVTESLAPILNGDNNNKSAYSKQSAGSDHSFGSGSKSPPANKSSGGLQNGKPLIGSSNHGTTTTSSSQRKSPDEAQLGNLHQHHLSNHKVVGESGRPNSSTLDLISSAALALKGAGAATAPVAPNATTINATLAKAPPELVQKQPAWVFCTRYSDRPSSGPRTRRAKSKDKKAKDPKAAGDDKRPRTAFTSEQLESLRREFLDSPYLDEKRRKDLADRLCLNENQIKIWFQNKRAKQKKQNNQPSPLRGLLVAGGLYNHSTATSDCSESYANGNDHENDDDDADNDCGDRNDLNDGSKNNNCNNIGKNKRSRNQQDNDGNLNFRNEDDTGMREPSNKRARLSNSGSESGSDCSRIEDLDDDEQVISVS